ncbi:hypothetical protein EB233_03345 [Mesorhizobium erdmanii]|uniref:Uncharacterized protein n=1 Tax=Mesorhizobium erdmanii TaxID=1777866 RepID=A0A6M7UBM5_9HYPH|nr:hypothetical protein EB233_03345 [Mesorhizobium erdmanii]
MTASVGGLAENINRFVILGRSKERSDAAQTPGSMPRLQGRCRGPEFCSAAPFDRDYGMDPRVSATELRSCSARG